MIKKFFILVFLLILSYGLAEGGQNVLIVRSMEIKPYDDALQGFKDICPCSMRELSVSELNGLNRVNRIREFKPDMVLALGKEALSLVKESKNIPIVYLMVLDPEPVLFSGEKNITGISMHISPEKQLATFQKILPNIKKIGLLFDPAKSGAFVKRARRAAAEIGLELITEEIYNPRQVPSFIEISDMKSKIDVFWMLPDTSVVCPQTVEFLLLFSLENKIPMVTFSDKYVEMGALMSLNIEAFSLGEQAGKMANKILSGKDARDISRARVEEIQLTINLKVADNLGIIFHKIAKNLRIMSGKNEIINRTKIVY